MAIYHVRTWWQSVRGITPETMPNYTLIEAGLYLGGVCQNPPPGVRAVLCVTPNRDAYSSEIYEWQPIHPGAAVTLDWIRRRVEFIDDCRRSGREVFVHCDAGIDRSAMVVVAYFMWRDALSLTDAIDVVQRKRAIRPNPAFLEMLAVWETHVRRR